MVKFATKSRDGAQQTGMTGDDAIGFMLGRSG